MASRKKSVSKNVEQLLNEIEQDAGVETIIDWLSRHDWGGLEYGYTVELEEEIEELEKRLADVPDNLPEIANLADQMKLDFFCANFAKIPLTALEWVVAEVEKKNIAV